MPKGGPFLKNLKDTYGGLALAKRFFEHCSSNWRTKGCQYAPSCAVVQSSGSGKSRLMVQIGQSVPMFYVCARHPGDTGHPPRTPLIVDHLLFSGRAASDDEIYSRCAAFYCVASLYARTMWKAVASTEEAVKHSLGGFLDQQLYEAFWKRFIAEMETIEAKVRAEVVTVDSSHADQTRWQLVEDRAHDVTAEYLHSDVFHNEGLSFVVCLDEAGNLGPRRSRSNPFDLLTQTHRASRIMSEKLGGVLVMLDTLCFVPAFGQRENFPSGRMRQFRVESRVFTNLLTYNLWPYTPRPIDQMVKLESLAEHGRPLWMACRSAHPARSYAVPDFAASKITGQIQLSGADIFGDSEKLGIALLAARVHLQIVSHTKLSEELVGYFMAHLNDIDSVGNSHAGYPSDPIVALGQSKATFVSQDPIPRQPSDIEPGSGEGGEEGLVQGKAKAGLASPSGDVPNAHRMSYIIVQCKNWMAEYYRAHPVVQVVSPLEEALEASGERKDKEEREEDEDRREKTKKTKNTKHKIPKKQ